MPTILERIKKSTVDVCRRTDLTRWQHEPAEPLPCIYGMYHVWCAPGWQTMVTEQMDRLRRTGLLAHTKTLFVSCITGSGSDADELRTILGSGPIEIISLRSDSTAFEFPALDFMYEKSQKEDFLFYYFHTKGISYQCAGDADRLFRGFNRKITAWRHMMEYFLMDQWRAAVNTLAGGYDTYGCYLFPPFKRIMYAGNFWWTRSDYFRTLPPLTATTKDNRFMAEEWLLSGHAKAFSAFDTVADLYDVRIDERQYASGKHSSWQSVRFFCIYTFRKYQKKWFHYSYKHRCQKRFQQLTSR